MRSSSRKSVVILGATSGVARSIADQFAQKGYVPILAGRRLNELESLAVDIRTRHSIDCPTLAFDALAFETHAAFPDQCAALRGELPQGVVLCVGYMAEQTRAQESFARARRMLDTNTTGAISILEQFATVFEKRGEGFIAALTSVAGDRGRKSNYLYGASKAGLNTYLQGLRNRLYRSNVQVITIKPGFMDTPMTYGLDLPRGLVTSPETAARVMVRAILKRKNVVYVPFFWKYIMFVIRCVPEMFFKRMNL